MASDAPRHKRQTITRKILLVERDDKPGEYNFMAESHEGRTMTKQLTELEAMKLEEAIFACVVKFGIGSPRPR